MASVEGFIEGRKAGGIYLVSDMFDFMANELNLALLRQEKAQEEPRCCK